MNMVTNDKIEKYLNELSEEYKMLLYKAIIERSNPQEDLSVSELLRLDHEIKKPLYSNYKQEQKKRRVYILIGVSYILTGFAAYVFWDLYKTFTYDFNNLIELTSLIVVFFGILIAFWGIIYPMRTIKNYSNITTKKQNDMNLLDYDVITLWKELEGIVNELSIADNVDSPRSSIEFLLKNKYISIDDSKVLRDFLKIRNSIAHQHSNSYSKREVKDTISEVEEIISKINRIL